MTNLVMKAPLLVYVVLTVLLNLPPVLLGVSEQGYLYSRWVLTYSEQQRYTAACRGDTAALRLWLYVDLLMALIDIGMAVYIAARVLRPSRRQSDARRLPNESPLVVVVTGVEESACSFSDEKRHSASSRPCRRSFCTSLDSVLSYDEHVAWYMWVALGWCLWQFIGFYLCFYDGRFSGDECDRAFKFAISLVLKCGFAYMSFVSGALSVFLYQTSREDDNEPDDGVVNGLVAASSAYIILV